MTQDLEPKGEPMSNLISRKAAIDKDINVPINDTISRQAAVDRINKQRKHLQPDVYPQDKIGDAAYRICAEFIDRLPSAQPDLDEWCTDCKEYDSEKHCCPRFNRVIKNALKDARPEIIRCGKCKHRDKRYLCDVWDEYISNEDFYCGCAEEREDEIN